MFQLFAPQPARRNCPALRYNRKDNAAESSAFVLHSPFKRDTMLTMARNPHSPRHCSCTRRRFTIAILVVWIVAITSGVVLLADYSSVPGRKGVSPRAEWPSESQLELSTENPTVLVFLHPRCPCSRATLRQLARLSADCKGMFELQPVFYCPLAEGDGWAHTDLWTTATTLTTRTPFVDRGGTETARFGARTSGYCLLFSSLGKQRFSGGVTAGRGHEGSNLGYEALTNLLKNHDAPAVELPVYGCAIY